MYKILIDARMIGLEHAGIGRYIANLVREIKNEKLKIKNFKIILLTTPKGKKQLTIEQLNHETIIINAKHYTFKEQLLIPWLLLKIRPDLIHFPHFNVPVFCPYPFVVTIHDLIKHSSRGRETTTRSQPIYWLKYWLYRIIFWWTIKRARRIITPSQAVKEELIKRYRINPNKIVPIYQGVGGLFRMENLPHKGHKIEQKAQKILAKYGIKKPFLVYTGSLYPHKNISRLIQSIKVANQSTINNPRPRLRLAEGGQQLAINLTIVCARNIFWQRMKKKIQKMKAEKFVKLVGFIPDKDLISLYQEAIAFIQPSLMEGFDLPALEAMAVGLPCLLSDIPVHREIYQDVPWYFNPQEIADISRAVRLALEKYHSSDYATKVEKGKALVQKFTWQKTTQQTLRVYQQALKNNG